MDKRVSSAGSHMCKTFNQKKRKKSIMVLKLYEFEWIINF